jgi:hypothetical protein
MLFRSQAPNEVMTMDREHIRSVVLALASGAVGIGLTGYTIATARAEPSVDSKEVSQSGQKEGAGQKDGAQAACGEGACGGADAESAAAECECPRAGPDENAPAAETGKPASEPAKQAPAKPRSSGSEAACGEGACGAK